jgi:hypothetical protein
MAIKKKQYLSEEFIAQLDKFNLRARLIVEGFITGLHKSPYHGFSVEFCYCPAYGTVSVQIKKSY